MIVEVIEGNIEDQQTDVIVNTTTLCLTLSKGVVSRAILQAAGHELQTECSTKYPQGIKYGDVAVTEGGNLTCKFVYHVTLPGTWVSHKQATTKYLQSVVKMCLQTADDGGHKSITFPLLGTGQLQYPCDTVTELITNTAKLFQAKSLERVKVVGPSTNHGVKRTSTEMAPVIKKKRQNTPSPECSPEKSTKQSNIVKTNTNAGNQMCTDGKSNDKAPLSSSSTVTSPEPSTSQISNNSERTTTQINIAMVTGNIMHQTVDAIVVSAEPDLSFDRENMRKAIAQTAGSSVQEECRRKYPDGLQYGQMAFTSGGNLKCKQIYHVVLPPWRSDASTEKIYRTSIYAILKIASIHKHTSIAFPLLGCGALKYPADDVAAWLFESIHDFDVRNPSRFLKEVQIVVLPNSVPSYEAQSVNVNLTLAIGHKANLRNVASESGCTHDWSVFVRSPTGSKIDSVIRKVVFKLHDTFINPKITVNTSPFEISRSGYGAFLLPIEIYTDNDDVPKKTIHYAMYLNKHGEPAVDHVQQETLFFRNPSTDLRQKLLDAGGVLEKKNDEATSSIIAGIESPSNWTPMGPKDFFKIVPLQPSDEEYKEVAKSFSVSMARLTIVSIERIQNRTLYLQYQAMRRQFQTRNHGIENERILWHGTGVDSTTSINMHGFNRSYCGKNATCFGSGVYFARKSAYSAQEPFSPKDRHGLKRIYQAKVLTGQFTKGHSSFRVPPPRYPEIPHDRFDCVVDNTISPEIFVIFQDAQAYPCYLITFK